MTDPQNSATTLLYAEPVVYGMPSHWAHELVSKQAVETPDAIAISPGGLTYRQLNEKANRLARHLIAAGVTAGMPVGLFFERSADFTVAALAVLKTGATYLPLDPAFPPARIDAILQDARVSVLVSHKWMAASLSGRQGTTIDLDVDARKMLVHSSDPFNVPVRGEDCAYLIYTSGSTGTPKGVQVSHANLAHLIAWHRRAFSVTPRDRASQVAGLAFDATVWETWCHLAAGASVHLIDETSRRSPEGLRDWLAAENITIAFVPTIMAEHLITFDWPAKTALRFLLTGADTLHRYPKHGLPFTLVNNYGPTECTVLVTSGTVADKAGQEGLPSIGRPIDDTEILFLDDNLDPVADGEPGEICVAGPQVALGYLNLPELTAEKFVILKNGTRIYRTGDRGCLLPDGEIAFLGRNDDQIKIRGFRVEPDEIVCQLNANPLVRNSAVVAHGDSADSKTITAYIVPIANAALTAGELRLFLQSRVPDYMVPSAFVQLDALPMTATGKCDRLALPKPSPANMLPEAQVTAETNVSEQSPTEQKLTQLVSGVMDSRAVGRDDNFFLIGGHSMLAAQLLARVRESFGVHLNLRQLFEAPTIATLSQVVEKKLSSK